METPPPLLYIPNRHQTGNPPETGICLLRKWLGFWRNANSHAILPIRKESPMTSRHCVARHPARRAALTLALGGLAGGCFAQNPGAAADASAELAKKLASSFVP